MGLTPLHLAIKSTDETVNLRIVRQLLIRGADRNIKDQFGRRPIDIAQMCKIPQIKREMMSYLVIFFFNLQL